MPDACYLLTVWPREAVPVGPQPAGEEEGGQRDHGGGDAVHHPLQRFGADKVRAAGRDISGRELEEVGAGRIIHAENC